MVCLALDDFVSPPPDSTWCKCGGGSLFPHKPTPNVGTVIRLFGDSFEKDGKIDLSNASWVKALFLTVACRFKSFLHSFSLLDPTQILCERQGSHMGKSFK